ncbi:hypothetical protein [Desulforamulus ruminis]|uniref:hypothetical protein n=1 Tax=Desulforamulus ruminis TaxID=1564 RepID=UPI0023550432|nr:hypothetical protein [Desulforamulus ruminis]
MTRRGSIEGSADALRPVTAVSAVQNPEATPAQRLQVTNRRHFFQWITPRYVIALNGVNYTVISSAVAGKAAA